MRELAITNHAAVRMAQRNISVKDSELIALIGTEVDEGYLVRARDYQEVERLLKELIERFRRLIGKRLIIAEGRIVTAYHTSKACQRRILRDAHECDIYE